MSNASRALVSAQADAQPEQWRDVVGYEARYEVSDQGRVWSHKNKKVLKPAPTSKGYLTVNLYDGSSPKKPRSRCVHDLVMAAFVGPKPTGMQVDHKDANKLNNALSNLEYVSGSENVLRAERRGLNFHPTGVSSVNGKLTERDVAEIRRRGWNVKRKDLAAEFDVSTNTILHVLRGKTYPSA
jgi:HNH endonuclease/NUMOD4 motif-containing protein